MKFFLRHFLFRLDAEVAHVGVIRLLGWLGRLKPARRMIQMVYGGSRTQGLEPGRSPFPVHSPVGLAAGLDKNGEIVSVLPSFGFGFAEIGTVTLRPQPGNPRPRLFRDLPGQSLFNCMGFNNDGAAVIAERLRVERTKGRVPAGFSVGVNLGKNKNTSPEGAATDYALSAAAFRDLADYLVVNVSSPNTPGLRALQQLEPVKRIVGGVLQQVSAWKRRVPVFLKLSPEAIQNSQDQLGVPLPEFLETLQKHGVSGWILTNTWGGKRGELIGGWSGAAVRNFSREALIRVRPLTRLPIISVGGIDSVQEARMRLDQGADLIQIYSHWVLNGPGFASELSKELSKSLKTQKPQVKT